MPSQPNTRPRDPFGLPQQPNDEVGDLVPLERSGLDALVTSIAVELTSATANSLGDALEWTLRVLHEFFEVDTSFLRRNDPLGAMSVLVAEWPRRENVPIPDPLGEVPFGADPALDATRDLKMPFVIRPSAGPDADEEPMEEGARVGGVSMAIVPLINDPDTVGVLGFVKFGDRAWDEAETNSLQAVASLITNLPSRIAAEESLRYQAYHDELTNLPNRRAFLHELHRRVSRGPATMSLLLLDLDRFKVVNDFLGNAAGDRLLTAVAQRLRGAVVADDFVARLAGDEFALLLDGAPTDGAVLDFAAELITLVEGALGIGGHEISRSASIGISLDRDAAATAEGRLAHADAALRRAKALGGGQAVLFDGALRSLAKQRSDTELLLREAIDHDGLLLHYQPEVDLRTGALLAVEALVRWNHPQRGFLSAEAFIDVAEETGLVGELGWWVLNEACRQMSAWRTRYPQRDFVMRVNISPAQLARSDVVRRVGDCLSNYHLSGRLLCLEITERAVVQDADQAIRILHELKSLGVSLAIDDFGTGYSSMSQLKQLPVDALKIDQTFVAGLGTDDGDRAIVDATIHLARSFGLEVIAEGVETFELLEELVSLGCHRAQGLLLSRPRAAGDLGAILLRGGLDPADLVRPGPPAAR